MFSALKGLYNSLWIQRLLTHFAVAVILWILGEAMGGYVWWLVVLVILVLLLEYLAFYRGIEYGIRTFNNMSRSDQIKLMKILDPDNEHKNNNYL